MFFILQLQCVFQPPRSVVERNWKLCVLNEILCIQINPLHDQQFSHCTLYMVITWNVNNPNFVPALICGRSKLHRW